MNTFIALELPEHVKNALCAVQAQLPSHVEKVDRAKLHLTLRFVGPVSDAQQEAICEGLRQINFTPFRLQLYAVGKFSNLNKVVWVNVDGQIEELRDLARWVGAIAKGAKSNFYPHITLGRTKRQIDVRGFDVEPVEFIADKVQYIKADKSEGVTKYVVLAVIDGTGKATWNEVERRVKA